MAWIMALSWEAVRVTMRLSSMNVDVDSSRDSNVGVRVRTVELPIPAWLGDRRGQRLPVVVRRVTASMRRWRRTEPASTALVSMWSRMWRAASWLPVRA
jgi:hypothetical protein